MAKTNASKIATGLIVGATFILAGIAIFTALRLYQLRQEPVAPTAPSSQPMAFFDCSFYDLIVDVDGTVRVHNVSGGDRPSQNLEFLIDGVSIGNFNIPALNEEEVAILGNLNLPPGDYNWSIQGVEGCQLPGEPELTSCQETTFTITSDDGPTPTTSPTSTPTPTDTPVPTATTTPASSPTPTDPPIGGADPTPTATSTPVPTATSTPADVVDGTTEPTQIAQVDPETLPEAGVTTPTIYLAIFLFLIIIASLAFAI